MHYVWRHFSVPSLESVHRNRPNVLTLDEAFPDEATIRRFQSNVKRNVLVLRRERNHDHQARGACIEKIVGDDQSGSFASLLMPGYRIELN